MKRYLILGLLVTATTAQAEPVVLAVQGNDIYVDLGAKDGVGAGSELELLHEITARDPRSGATLRDRFALGTITVARSGNAVSIAHADLALSMRVVAGDHVRLVSAKRAFVDPWAEQVAASKGQPAPLPAAPSTTTPPPTNGPPIDHAALARDAWQETLGQKPQDRIDRWRALLLQDPQTPYRAAIDTEIASLRDQMQQREAMIARARSTASTDRNPRIAQLIAELETGPDGGELIVSPIERAVPGRPIQLAFLARRPGMIRSAWLYVRPAGAPGFTRSELTRDGDAYLRGTIEGALVRGKQVDWYVEATSAMARDRDSDAEPVLGSQVAPRTIVIDDIVSEAPIEPNRTHIDAHIDYVDFDGGFNDGFDQYYQAELDFTYRFIEPVYAMRLGFGTLSGKGGPKDVIDEDLAGTCRDMMGAGQYQCERVTFSYVYTEAEFRLRPSVALMVRPQAGILTTDPTEAGMDSANRCETGQPTGCEFDSSFGLRGRLRLGSEDGTNLVIGAAFTSKVGTLLEAAYHWLPNKVVPVQITVQVTDQPVVEDFGVRLIADVGIRQVSWFYPSVRLSYQARDIDHSGLSGGAALNFDW